nr:hypothetical protein [uncultured Draconibacterium sp.]
MKKFIIAFTTILFWLSGTAQDFDNRFYFRAGYSSPSWSYFDQDKDFWGEGTSKYGANFELGTIFMINSALQSKEMVLGIDAVFLYTNFNNFKYEDELGSVNTGIYRVGSKIGPSFTYSPAENLAFDVYVKADIAWVALIAPYEEKIDDGDDYFIDYLPVGFSTGVNFRYGMLMLGIEFNTISPQLESDDFEGYYFQQYIDAFNEEEMVHKKTKMPNLNFTVGLNF